MFTSSVGARQFKLPYYYCGLAMASVTPVLLLVAAFLLGAQGATYEVQNKTIGGLQMRRLMNTLTGNI